MAAGKTSAAKKELDRLFGPAKKGKGELVKTLSAGLKLQHQFHQEYQAQLRELTSLVKELAALEREVDTKIKINKTKGKIKDL